MLRFRAGRHRGTWETRRTLSSLLLHVSFRGCVLAHIPISDLHWFGGSRWVDCCTMAFVGVMPHLVVFTKFTAQQRHRQDVYTRRIVVPAFPAGHPSSPRSINGAAFSAISFLKIHRDLFALHLYKMIRYNNGSSPDYGVFTFYHFDDAEP